MIYSLDEIIDQFYTAVNFQTDGTIDYDAIIEYTEDSENDCNEDDQIFARSLEDLELSDGHLTVDFSTIEDYFYEMEAAGVDVISIVQSGLQ